MALLPFNNSRGIKRLLGPDRTGGTSWDLAVDGEGGFRADDGADGAARAAFPDQVRGVVAFRGEMFHIEGEHVLGAGMDAQLASLAVDLANFNPTFYRHKESSNVTITISTIII
jgi:hypothetical protein